LLEHAAAGTRLDLLGGSAPVADEPDASPFELEVMKAWSAERTVRAEVLRHLLVGPDWEVHAKGVRLRGARISGHLDLESATLRCPLILQDCYLDSEQPVVLDYATVSRLSVVRCQLAGLTADLLVVTKELDLSRSTISGVFLLRGADITGQLICRGARITGTDRNALVAEGVKVGGAVFLDDGFTAAGAVRLLGADITGQLNCSGARITGTDNDRNALQAEGVKVGGAVVLDDGFTAAGAVRLLGAGIGDLILRDATLADGVALTAQGATIGGQLVWAPKTTVTGLVNLEQAQVDRLDDDWSKDGANWPHAGKLRLAGFAYNGFGGDHPATWGQRLQWIRCQHRTPLPDQPATFDAQPYEQLARTYRQTGEDTEARKIAIARHNDLRTYGHLSLPRRIGNWLLDVTIKHGYQPLRAVGLLLAAYAIAVLAFWGAQHHDVMVPARNTSSLDPPPTALTCTADYPCFYPAGYAIDITIPIVRIGQAEAWRPNGAADWGWAYLAGTWVITGLGWAFTTLAVAGYTGLIRKD
jgi:hypothetical protein